MAARTFPPLAQTAEMEYHVSEIFGAGWKSPPAVKDLRVRSPRAERLIRCDSGADCTADGFVVRKVRMGEDGEIRIFAPDARASGAFLFREASILEAATVNTTRRMVWTALLSAVAAVLMYIDMAVPLFPRFLKLDLSDLPALVAAFAWGPAAGIFTELIKNLIHSLTTSTAGVGELANFLVGSALVIPAGMIYRRKRTRKGALLGLAAGTLSMTLTAAAANYLFLLPFYSNFIPLEKIIAMSSAAIPAVRDMGTLVLYAVVPFNLLKGTVVSLATVQLYKRISPLIR